MLPSVTGSPVEKTATLLNRRRQAHVLKSDLVDEEEFIKAMKATMSYLKTWASSVIKMAVYHFPEDEERLHFLKKKIVLSKHALAR